MILVNGEASDCLDATDRGLHYGDGVFETIAIRHGVPQLWQWHMERLAEGCRRLAIPPPDETQLAAECTRLCGAEERAVLKVIITRGSGGRGYRPPTDAKPTRLLARYPWPDYPDVGEGVRLRLCATPLGCNAALAGIKHLNRLEQVLARSEWDDTSIHEGLMCDTQGYLIEGTMSNLFAVRGGVLYTPDLSGCGVAGVMRREVLRLAGELQIAVEFRRITPGELQEMDEVFMTNSIIGIWPVRRFDSAEYGANPLTCRLLQRLTGTGGEA